MRQKQLKAEEYEGYCEYCHEEHQERDLVPVIGGEVIGEYTKPEPHLAVTGIDSRLPDVEYYCPHRYASEFDTEPSEGIRKEFDRAVQWLRWEVITAFSTGAVLTALLFFFLTP